LHLYFSASIKNYRARGFIGMDGNRKCKNFFTPKHIGYLACWTHDMNKTDVSHYDMLHCQFLLLVGFSVWMKTGEWRRCWTSCWWLLVWLCWFTQRTQQRSIARIYDWQRKISRRCQRTFSSRHWLGLSLPATVSTVSLSLWNLNVQLSLPLYSSCSQWHCGMGQLLSFSLLENFRPQIPNLGLNIPHCYWQNWNFEHPLCSLCEKFAAVCQKIVTFHPSYFFSPQRHWLNLFPMKMVENCYLRELSQNFPA